jgi:hypothetical protein
LSRAAVVVGWFQPCPMWSCCYVPFSRFLTAYAQIIMLIAMESSGWISLGVAGMALAASAFATWLTVSREGSRTMFADQTARNAQFQMAKRDVYASLLSAGRAYGEEPRSETKRDEFQRELARGLMHARADVVQILEDELGPDFPDRAPDWYRLTTVLRDDIG